MGIIKRMSSGSKSCKSSRNYHMLKDIIGDDGRLFTLESLGAPEKVHLPVDVIERQRFSKIAESSMREISADEILCKKREALKKNLKDFIHVAFPSSTNPYRYLLSSPGPISNLEKFYMANQRELKPPKYRVYFDIARNSYFYTLDFNDHTEYSDAMPIKVLAKLQVAYKALLRIRRQMKAKAEKERAAKELAEKIEKMKAIKETTEEAISVEVIEVNQVKDQPPKELYLHPRVQKLWANKKRGPKDDNWFMKNISRRNFSLFKEIYPRSDEFESTSKKRKVDWNEVETFQEGVYSRIIKKVRKETV